MPTFEELQREADEYAAASPDRRRTIRQLALIARGIHPATKAGLADNGETCGSCAHRYRTGWSNRPYYKCELVPHTFGPGTDIRLSWPACTSWEGA